MVGSPEAPYFNELIAAYGLSEAFQGVAHPSQGNYIAMVSGSSTGPTPRPMTSMRRPSSTSSRTAVGRGGSPRTFRTAVSPTWSRRTGAMGPASTASTTRRSASRRSWFA
jgi:hypothetical protein